MVKLKKMRIKKGLTMTELSEKSGKCGGLKMIKVDRKKAEEIVFNRLPVGKFYFEQNGDHVGIENTTHDAEVRFFKIEQECISWLNA